jgi:hypothetical protein
MGFRSSVTVLLLIAFLVNGSIYPSLTPLRSSLGSQPGGSREFSAHIKERQRGRRARSTEEGDG